MTIIRHFAPPLALLACLFAPGFVSDAHAQRVFRATLDGTQEVPPVTGTAAAGTGTVELNVAETSIAVTMSFSGLSSNQTASHIHGNSARGVSSGVLFNIGSSGTTSGTFSFNQAVTPADVANLKAGLWYFNVHSANFGGGEIRGQIEPDCSSLPGGLVSWWQGEGNGFDQNSLNNGTVLSATTYSNGKVGRGFSFPGTVNSGVTIPHNTNLDVNPSGFSAEFWMKSNGAQAAQVDLLEKSHGFVDSTGWAFQAEPGGTTIAFFIGAGGGGDTNFIGVTSLVNPFDGNYHHIAGTWDGSNVRLYIDGVLQGTTPFTSPVNNTRAVNIGFASGGGTPTRRFNGIVDEVGIFSRSMTAAEITSIYNAGAAGKCPPCIATPVGMAEWWTGDGSLLGNRNRNNGSLVNATFAEGRNGHAFKFNGFTSTFNIPNSPTVNFTNQFTMDAWISPAILHAGIAQGAVFSKVGGMGGNNGFQFGLTTNNTQIFCQFNGVGEPWPTNQLIANVPAGGLPLNSWSHIACTYNNANLTVYLDGAAIGTLAVGPKTMATSTSNLKLSGDDNNNVFFTGLIDEPHLFNRALSATEIASIVNAGNGCFCKPGATTAPSNLVGWWSGDGGPNDISGNGNNGLLQNGAGFAVGRVGQSFAFDGVDDAVSVPSNANQVIGAEFSAEAWIFPRTVANNSPRILNKGEGIAPFHRWLMYVNQAGPANAFGVTLTGTGGNFSALTPANSIPLNQWSHVAFAYNNNTNQLRLYINGIEAASATGDVGTMSFGGPVPLIIGNDDLPNPIPADDRSFDGLIDEPSIYSRALTQAEVQSIYNAGIAGKLKQTVTQFNTFAENRDAKGSDSVGGFGPVTMVGDATIFFQGTSGTPGLTQWMPVSQLKLPPLPTQWQGLTYDLSTTWAYTGINSVCFNVPSFTPTQFSSLRIYHLESDNWVNRTNPSSMYPNLCTNSLPSLSPFAIGNLIPNAANVNVGGRVVTAGGNGVSNAVVYFTDSQGVTRTARTGSLGYFRFDDVLAGETYVVVINHKRYTFAPRVVTVEDEITELDFVAIE